MDISNKIVTGISLSVIATSPILGQKGSKKPNVIIIMADQLRADLLQREGYPLNTMPFADKLAKEGTWFDRAYTSAPASGPARVSMLTGRFPSSTHVKSNHNIQDAYYTKDLFDVAKEQGYSTALIGKNHSHLTPERIDYWSPYNHGGQESKNKSELGQRFDKYLGTLDMYANMQPSPYSVEAQLPYRMVNDASEWIDTQTDNPFLMWLSIAEPHNPYQVCEPYYFIVFMFPNYQTNKFSSLIISKFPKLKTNLKNVKSKKHQILKLSNLIDRLKFVYSPVYKIYEY